MDHFPGTLLAWLRTHHASCRPLLRPLTVWSSNFDLNHFCFHYLWFHGFSSLITFPYICIYSHFKFCCFASMCDTSMYVFVKRYTMYGLTYVTSVKVRDANLIKLTRQSCKIKTTAVWKEIKTIRKQSKSSTIKGGILRTLYLHLRMVKVDQLTPLFPNYLKCVIIN